MVAAGLAKLDTPKNDGQLAQFVTDILAENELTSGQQIEGVHRRASR